MFPLFQECHKLHNKLTQDCEEQDTSCLPFCSSRNITRMKEENYNYSKMSLSLWQRKQDYKYLTPV